MHRRRLPLNALRAFEGTARLQSMSAAAEDMGVTHGAVSRHVRMLEELLGAALFARAHNTLITTPEGARLAERLSTAFNIIEGAVDEFRPGPLTISCSASIMMYWLLPRIASFHRQWPKVDLQFHTNFAQVDFIRDKVSVAIRNNTIPTPKEFVSKPLIREWIGPVCSPGLLASSKIANFRDLAKAHRLVSRTRPDAWSEWAVASGNELLEAHDRFDHFYVLIQAAACDLGVALVPRMLVLADLQSGKLVAPLGFVEGPRELMLWIAPHLASKPETRSLVAWLQSEMQETSRTDSEPFAGAH